MIFPFFYKSFAYRKWRFPFQRREVSHTQTFSRVWLKVMHCHRVAAFLLSFLKNSHPHERMSWRTPCLIAAPFSLQHSTLSLLDLPNRTNPCVPPQGLVFGRFAEQSPLTGYEPNAPVEVNSTKVMTILLHPRKASIGSTYNSGEDTTPAASEVDERSNLGKLASPLSTQEREASAIPFRIYN